MKLLVGLGNPGSKYAHNRHNIGFMAVEAIAHAHRFGPWKSKFQARVAEGEIDGVRTVLLQPQTYMNESGRTVQEAARFLKIEDADIIVLHDELDLTPGKVRVKKGGGNAGHNGLRSITAHRTNEYWRVRLGIGHPGQKELVHNWVLNDFAKSEHDWVNELLRALGTAAPWLVKDAPERFMSEVARLTGAEPEKPAKTEAPSKPGRVSGHPAAERVNKQQNAITQNLAKWLAAKKAKDGE